MSRLAMAMLALAAGAALGYECGRQGGGQAGRLALAADTLVSRLPAAADSVALGHDTIWVERPARRAAGKAPAAEPEREDSVAVAVPITQARYATAEAEVWVSGYKPRLDSLRLIRPRLELPASKPKRWHVGITAGAAITPAGVQPCVSVGLTYSFYSF